MNPILDVTTPSDLEIVMTREFDAPRRLVWDAMTKPELIRRWIYAPQGWVMSVCEGGMKTGDSFRWALISFRADKPFSGRSQRRSVTTRHFELFSAGTGISDRPSNCQEGHMGTTR